jgi:hypothetical protein
VLYVIFFLRIVLSDLIEDLVLVSTLRLDDGCEGQCRHGLLDSRHVEETGGPRGFRFDWFCGRFAVWDGFALVLAVVSFFTGLFDFDWASAFAALAAASISACACTNWLTVDVP